MMSTLLFNSHKTEPEEPYFIIMGNEGEFVFLTVERQIDDDPHYYATGEFLEAVLLSYPSYCFGNVFNKINIFGQKLTFISQDKHIFKYIICE